MVSFSEMLLERSKGLYGMWQRRLHNKIVARNFAQKHGLQVPKLYSLSDEPEYLSFQNRCVVKPTLGESCKNVFLLDNWFDHMSKKQVSKEQVISRLKVPLYPNSKPQYICEEFLDDDQGNIIPNDYKFYIFGGEKIAGVWVVNRNIYGAYKNRNRYYNEDFTLVGTKIRDNTNVDKDDSISPPSCYEDMKKDALKFASKVGIFVRVDMYATKRGPVFGEITLMPNAGKNYTDFGNEFLGKVWEQYPDQPISCKSLI